MQKNYEVVWWIKGKVFLVEFGNVTGVGGVLPTVARPERGTDSYIMQRQVKGVYKSIQHRGGFEYVHEDFNKCVDRRLYSKNPLKELREIVKNDREQMRKKGNRPFFRM